MTEKVDDQSVRPKILTGILKGENRQGKGAIYQKKKKKKKTRKLPRIEGHEFQDLKSHQVTSTKHEKLDEVSGHRIQRKESKSSGKKM